MEESHKKDTDNLMFSLAMVFTATLLLSIFSKYYPDSLENNVAYTGNLVFSPVTFSLGIIISMFAIGLFFMRKHVKKLQSLD